MSTVSALINNALSSMLLSLSLFSSTIVLPPVLSIAGSTGSTVGNTTASLLLLLLPPVVVCVGGVGFGGVGVGVVAIVLSAITVDSG